jgi:uncharacterized secreted protein with C-terminal beta-propeller domain
MPPAWDGLVTVGTAPAAPTEGAAPGFSTTTVQETGVDEIDLIKSDGRDVFSLDPTTNNVYRRDRLQRQRLDATASQAVLAPLETMTLPFSADVGGTGLYLDDTHQQLVALGRGGLFAMGIYDAWFMPYYWTAGVTEALFIDTSDANSMAVKRHLRLTGQLIGSRRIADSLYLVLRSYPQTGTLDGVDPATVAVGDVLPTITVDGGEAQPLVTATDCLLQADNAAATADIITLVAVDLAAAGKRHAARCFTGGVEAFYMSPKNIYLATTRYRYSLQGGFPVYADQSSTDLHKFALNGLNIGYRGSGNVLGHLGFDQNRKSFRMGEHEGFLRVITQIEPNFSGWFGVAEPAVLPARRTGEISSPGHLHILQETADGLEIVGQLPNATRPQPLGKPGEQLYASRFIGSRGYLVTFRLTDPLYVLDLSNPTDPYITGELEISGYSDYLFPLGETLLLGIGKDAVSDGSSGDGRFAWYQGVKLALIDIADPTQPRELARSVIGQRGTDAAVLHDHHGIALQSVGQQMRIGLPVRRHDTPSPYTAGQPSDYYQFTRNELQRFVVDLETRTLQALNPLPSSLSQERSIFNDRALLWQDQVHYYQDGIWLSTPW